MTGYCLDERLAEVEQVMLSALQPGDGDPSGFFRSMQYAMGWVDAEGGAARTGGKRFRPRLCLLSCAAAGGDPAAAVPAAAAVELLHNFTLVHDDIQDGSPQRHHRPSVWNIWGVPLAINTGDGMMIASHLTMQRLLDAGLPPELTLRAVLEMDSTALRICEGQHRDISFERRTDVSSAEYLEMIGLKTGVLMGLSCLLGALAAGCAPASTELYRRFGESLGTAYQIRDDLDGVWGEETATGKRAMEDVYSRKKSYPAVRAFELAGGADADRLRSVYEQDELSIEDALWLRALMTGLGIESEGRERLRALRAEAQSALRAAGASGPAAEELSAFAERLFG